MKPDSSIAYKSSTVLNMLDESSAALQNGHVPKLRHFTVIQGDSFNLNSNRKPIVKASISRRATTSDRDVKRITDSVELWLLCMDPRPVKK